MRSRILILIMIMCISLLTVDSIYAQKRQSPPKKTLPTEQTWKVKTSKSDMTDQIEVVLTLKADNTVVGIIEPVRPVLILRCKEGKFEVFVNSGFILDSDIDSETKVRIRMDDDVPFVDTWSISTDNMATFCNEPAEFLERVLLKCKKLRIGMRPFDATERVATFNVRGLEMHISTLIAACGNEPQEQRETYGP